MILTNLGKKFTRNEMGKIIDKMGKKPGFGSHLLYSYFLTLHRPDIAKLGFFPNSKIISTDRGIYTAKKSLRGNLSSARKNRKDIFQNFTLRGRRYDFRTFFRQVSTRKSRSGMVNR